MSNATLGTWLFLASEVMLFGALFSSYVLLRTGAASWPDQQALLNVPLGAANTLLMIGTSATILFSGRALTRGEDDRARRLLLATSLGGALFIVIKGIEYAGELREGLGPATNNFLGLYFTMTALHALHVAGGVGVNMVLWADRTLLQRAPARYASRLRSATLYWNFVDVVWLAMFAVLYLA